MRAATDHDLDAITGIYAEAVNNGTGTFETEPPTVDQMAERLRTVRERGLPWIVAEHDGAVVGFAYANWFRPRSAYAYYLEDSIYLAPQVRRQGVGRALLDELIDACTQLGARHMVAVIGDSQNAGSIGLHTAAGFEHTGVLRSAGWKHGRWLDVVLMQRALGDGDTRPPA